MLNLEKVTKIAATIQLLILDVDGVLTNGNIWYDSNGVESKQFNTQDGHGLRQLAEHNIDVAIISGNHSPSVTHRMNILNIDLVYQGQQKKQYAFEDILKKTGYSPTNIAYMGDDEADMLIIQQIGLKIAVNNAIDAVKAIVDWETKRAGGQGAVREICDLLIASNHAHEKKN